MGTQYTVGAKIIINYDQSEIKSTIQRLNNFVKANPITIDKIKIESGALNNIKSNLEKLSIKLDNVSINNVKLPSTTTNEIRSKIESISFKLGNLKLDTSKIDGKKVNLTLNIPSSEITKLREQIEGLRPIIKVQVQGVNQVANPGIGSLAQAKTFADSITTSGQYAGNTLISYEYDQTGKLIAVLKNAQNETIRLKYQFDEASKSFQQIGSNTKVPDLLNQSTASAQRAFADIRNITEQFKLLQQQAGNNPIDFKTQQLIPNLELLNTKLKTLSNGMQQVTQVYKLNETQTMSVSGNYNMLRGQMDSLSTSTGNLMNRQIGLGEAINVAFSRFPLWIVVSTTVMGAIHKVTEAFDFMFEQSKLFTNLQLEMTNTNLVFGDITNTANQFASAMGTTTDSVMKAIATFGTYSSTLDDILQKSQSAVVLSNITGQGIEQTSDELMGILTQYQLTAKDITGVTDSVLGASRMLQMDFPKAVAEVSSGLRTVGSVAKDAGLSVAETTGILSTMVEVTRRSGAEEANALRTVISRISNVGEESDPEEFKKIEKQFYNIGIAIKSSATEIRPLGEILAQLGERWKTLNNVERQSIAQSAAGMYRRNAFVSLMNNYNEVLKNTEAAENSEGVTMAKQEIYSNSLAASIQRLTAAWEKFYLNAINNDTWKLLVQGLTSAVTGFANFADVVGGIPAVLSSVVLSASLLSEKFRNFMSGLLGFNTIGKFIADIKAAQLAMIQLNGTKIPLVNLAFREISASVWVYIAAIKEAYIQQVQLGRTNNLNPLITQFNALRAAATAAGVASKLAGLALSAGLAVATLGLSVVLSVTIGKLMEFADNMIHAKEKAQETFDTLQKSISSLSSEVTQSESLISTYKELSNKKNKTTEETQKLAEATEKLSNLLPQSIIGFDSEGKAIIGSADSLREYLDLKRQELDLDKQKLVSDFYKNESSQVDDIIKKQQKLNDLRDKLIHQQEIKTNIISSDGFISDQKVSLLADKDVEINKIKGEIAEVQTAILQANSTMSSGLKATVQTELESLNLSSTTLSNFSKSYLAIISQISTSGEKPAQVLSSLFSTFKTDTNIKSVIDGWNTSLEGLQKGNIDASKAEEIHTKAVNDLVAAISKDNPNLSKDDIIKPFVEGLLILTGVAPKAKEQISDVAKAIEEVDSQTELYLKNANDLASTVAKMNDGHKLTVEEIYKLVKAHPELTAAISKENGMLTLNKQAIEDVMQANDEAFKSKLANDKTELENSEKLLMAKLYMYGQDIKGMKTVAEARAKEAEAYNSTSGDSGVKFAIHETNMSTLDDLQKIEDELKVIGVASQITPKDLVASANPDLNKKSSSSTSPSVLDDLSALINGINAQSKLDEANNKAIQTNIDVAKSSKSYANQLKLTNDLLDGQKTRVNDLQEANNKLMALGDKIGAWGWVNDLGEATKEYYDTYDSSSETTQKQMDKEFNRLSSIKKAINSNTESIITLHAEINKTTTSLSQISIDKYNQSISDIDTSISQLKADQDLYNSSSEQYIKDQQQIIELQKQKGNLIDAESNRVKTALSSGTLNPESTQLDKTHLSSLTLASSQNQKDQSNAYLTNVKTIYETQQKQNSELQKSLDLQLQITEAVSPKQYDQISVILASQISAQNTNISQIQQAITSTLALRDATEQNSIQWQTLNEQALTYQASLESAIQTQMATAKSQEQNSINQQLNSTELTIFGGQTEAQAKQFLQDKQNYQQNYISGVEKQYEVESIIQDAQSKQLTLSQSQLDILNSTSDIKRSDLDLIQRQLTIQENQVKLADLQQQLTLEQATATNDQLQKELEYSLKIAQAQDPKDYAEIASIQQQMLTLQSSNVDALSITVNSLIKQRDALEQGSDAWNKINAEVDTYSTNLETASEQTTTLLQDLLKSQTSDQLQQIQTSIFGSTTGLADQKQALQDKINYQSEYISGTEKAAAVLRIKNQLQQNNASLNNGLIGTQQTQLQFTQDQLAILNSSNDIKRSDLDLLEKQLAIQKTQAELANSQNQKSVRVLTDQGNGNYQWNWQADQSKTLQLQGTLYQEQQDLAKTQQDNANKNAQTELDQKSEYYTNISNVVQNALNGQYATTTDFQTALTNVNAEFLDSLQGTNETTWNTISTNITGNLTTINNAYKTYTDKITSLNNSIVNSGITTKNNLIATNTAIIKTQTDVLNTLTTIDQQESAMAKAQIDSQLQNDQYLLDQKSEYYNNIKTVVDNALNGQYATTAEFQNKMQNANTGFLNSLEGTNASTWSNISTNVSSNTNSMIASYQNYVNQMAILQATANQIALSKSLTPVNVPTATASSSYYAGTTYNGVPVNDGSATYNNWAATHSHAGGTEDSDDGFAITSENGPELTYLNKGSAVIPANFTKNIMAFGSNPVGYMQNVLSNINIPKMPSFTNNLASSASSGESYNFYGDMKIVANNPTDLFSQLKQQARLK